MDDGHWIQWHAEYEDPTSRLSRRLETVKHGLSAALDERPAGPIRLVSMCAGQGRDVIEVLAEHPRGTDVQAHLIEVDPTLAADARTRAELAGLRNVTTIAADAAPTDRYGDLVPADIWMVCGLFGNISEDDIATVLAELPHLCASGATVIWTRHRRPPDHTTTIRAQLVDLGFTEISFDSDDSTTSTSFGVGAARFDAAPRSYRPGRTLFTFVGPTA